MRRPSVWLVLLLALTVMLSACSRRQQEWETARRTDTVEAYDKFLKSFPDGEFASQAQARVRELKEMTDWQKAMQADTPEAYQQFLADYPQGRMADEARIRIGNFALAQAPSDSPADAAALPPGEGPAAPATANAPAPAASGMSGEGYRIQLGAFTGGDKQAMGEWRRLQGEYPTLLKGLSPSVKLATTNAGHLYRLQAGKTSEARAREICAALKAKDQACVIVPP